MAYAWTRQDARRHDAAFSLDDTAYWATAYQTSAILPTTTERIDLWILNFGVTSDDSVRLHGHEHAIMKPTKLGRSPSVMATVLAIFNDFVSHVQPDTLWFSDIDNMRGRKRLYSRFARYLVEQHHYVFDEAVMQHFNEQSIWVLHRVNANQGAKSQ